MSAVFQRCGWNWGLKKRIFGDAKGNHAIASERAVAGRVRLISPADNSTATEIETSIVHLLERAGEMPRERLVSQIAELLYNREIQNRAWLLDIGVFGSAMFMSDAARELETGNGRLWQIN